MGRPLNKKYFGNRNIGSASVTTDDGIGGNGVASAAVTVAGSYTTTRPLFTFSAPTIPGGVTATGTVTSEVLSAAVGGVQTRAYPITAGAISFVGGTTTATFTATVTSSALTNVVRASATTLGFDTTTTAMISGTSIHITGASITGTMTIGGVAIAAGQIYYVGAPTDTVSATLFATYDNAVTATSPLTIVAGSGVTGATFTRGVTYGTVTALTPINRGAFEALVTGSQAAVCTTYGAALTITPTYRGKSVVITEKGSGYITAPTVVAGTGYVAGGITVATVALLTDSGNVGSVTNQENSITMTARLTGGTAVTVDIIKQVSGRRYKVTDGVRTGIVTLKASVATGEGEGSIRLVDTDNGTYFATKLTAHKATITRGDGVQAAFVTGTAVPWNMTAATATSLLIDNA
jgi:hypothetical protein